MKYSDWVSTAAFILSVVVVFRDCSQSDQISEQNKQISELDYSVKSLTFRPRLKVIGTPEVTSFSLNADNIRIDSLLLASPSHEEPVDVPMTLTLNTRITAVNTEDISARIYATIWTDTTSGDEKIREFLLDKSLRERRFQVSLSTDYYKAKEVQPHDTTYIDLSHRVKFSKDEKFTLHFLVLYLNEAGFLYDTYLWARYSTNPFLLKPEFGFQNQRLSVRFIYDKRQISRFLSFVDKNESSQSYTRDEAKEIMAFLNQKAVSVQ